MLYVIPIESYHQRYSEQWNRWFPEYLASAEIPHALIWGKQSNLQLNEGGVLDVFGTHLYKYDQLSQLVKLIRDGKITNSDVLFFHTLWYTGIDSLQYIRQISGINFRITGILHAGSYDPADFRTRYGMNKWAMPLEKAWFTFVDKIIVATKFHRDLLLSSIALDPSKVVIAKFPLNLKEIQVGRDDMAKEDLVAFPHRLVPEKDPGLIDRIKKLLPGVQIIKTRDVCTSKNAYYDLLAKCKICISNSFQETFGYSMLEAAALGTVPLVPDRLCYPEMYPEVYRFKSDKELAEKIRYFLTNWSDPRIPMKSVLDECDTATQRIIQIVLG